MAGVALLYPHFCDGVDPDATSYLTLARRWAAGDFTRAINGYWSPLSIWLTALLMRAGIPEIPAAFIQNTAGAVVFLGASLLLFRKYGVSQKLLLWTVPALGFFLLHAVFHQWFSDLWGAAFALLALRVLLINGFFRKTLYGLPYGLLVALAYLAKSLYLPFLIALTIVAGLHFKTVFYPAHRFRFVAGVLGIVGLFCIVWWMALWGHYGFFTTGISGALNLSWGVAGHAIFTPAGGPFLPPLFPDSISYWEDPWWANARLVHFWDSPQQFLKMIPRFGYFGLRLLQKSVLLSVFLPIAVFEISRQFFRNRFRLLGDFKTQLLQAALLLFPLLFLMLHTEVRYLWFLAPLTVIWVHCFLLDKYFNRLAAALLAASLCVHGIGNFPEIWHLGRAEKKIATALKAARISGDFATDASLSYAEGVRVAYFSGMRYWAAKSPAERDVETLRRALQKQGVPYLLSREKMIRTADGNVVWQREISGK